MLLRQSAKSSSAAPSKAIRYLPASNTGTADHLPFVLSPSTPPFILSVSKESGGLRTGLFEP